MKNSTACLFGGALLGAGLTNPAAADLSFTGAINQAYSAYSYSFSSYTISYGPTSIDTFDFTVLSDGLVQFDMLSFQIFNTWIDPMVFVFENDGNPLGAANLVDYNDDSASDINGSIDGLDSFLEVFLTAGEYTVAVGAFSTEVFDVATGESPFGIVYGDIASGFPDDGQYQLDIFGNVVVPAPGALAILGLGGMAATRRRR